MATEPGPGREAWDLGEAITDLGRPQTNGKIELAKRASVVKHGVAEGMKKAKADQSIGNGS